MSRDEETFEKPDEFIPERFENLSHDEFKACDPKTFVFGFGRR
jgi:cytochrome P450